MKNILEKAKVAAQEDFKKQTKYDNAYDRQKGFIEGVKWAISEANKKKNK